MLPFPALPAQVMLAGTIPMSRMPQRPPALGPMVGGAVRSDWGDHERE